MKTLRSVKYSMMLVVYLSQPSGAGGEGRNQDSDAADTTPAVTEKDEHKSVGRV